MGLVTSYVIGGILLIGILAMNMSLSQSSTELTLTQTTREKAVGVQEMLNHDIQKIGFNRNNKTSPVLVEADSHKVAFRSNIDNSSDNSVELVTWEFTNTSVGNGNPNAYVLKRTVKDVDTGSIISETPIRLGVTNFNIKYLDKYGQPVSNHMSTPVASSDLNSIRQLYIALELQSSAKVHGNTNTDGRFVRTIWEKRFSPPNLEDV
ncbi:hypothetical protein [Fodinibius sp.]|uniref:hypothetical protein n=1 Tax=Fodinibius sp. TaxID=1872440 RepID=UPI002ACE5964|nr:hypothetical protein [Fodinibius sp.]MDZ7660370.1 hypothetical protein [Fodinibius sp.]